MPSEHSHGTFTIDMLEQRLLFAAVFTVTNTNDSGDGSLRAAINNANTNPSTLSTIQFDLPAGVATIHPLSALPAITTQVDIIGTTDSGGNPLIQLDGADASGTVSGLDFARNTPGNSNPSTVSGLSIFRFSGTGIDIDGDAPTDVFGCHIGTDAAAKHSRPNDGDGIHINASGSQIGHAGVGPAFVNLIIANQMNGIEISSGGADAIVQNCLIGVSASGTIAMRNVDDGILVDAAGATIGGHHAHQGNVISGNGQHGIEINSGNCNILGNKIGTNTAGTAAIANGNQGILVDGTMNVSIGDSTDAGRNLITGNGNQGIDLLNDSQTNIDDNLIGTDITGAKALGNGNQGIVVDSSDDRIANCIIGGNENGIVIDSSSNITIFQCFIGVDKSLHAVANQGNGVDIFHSTDCLIQANTIADNGANGVEIEDSASVNNSISNNSIFSNGDLGINLGQENDTPLANHSGTVTGPNDDQNYPVLTSAVDVNGVAIVDGTITAAPNSDYFIELFTNDAADPSGFGEGQNSHGGATVVTDANGAASFSMEVGSSKEGFVSLGQFITATATFQPQTPGPGDTSEFSQAIAGTGASIVGTVFSDVNGNGKFDSGETGLKGRTVFVDVRHDGLFDEGDPSGTSDAHGHFRIFGAAPGTDRVRLLGTAGWVQTSPSPKKAFMDVSVAALSTTGGVAFGQEKSTAKAATLAVDAGSFLPYVDLSGQTFAADAQNPQNGLASPVAGTDDDPLYSVDAEAQVLHYTFSVPNGKYTLKLFFFDQDSTAAGQRTFNLTANGAELLKHFDIFAAAGAARTALVKSSSITISNKTLALVFKGILGSAIVSAIELIPN